MAAGGAERRPRYFMAREVAEAGRPQLSALGRVYDLGPLLRERRGDVTLAPLLGAVGTDVSHCFDPESGDPLPRVEPRTGQTGSRYPLGTPGSSQSLTPRSDGAPPVGRRVVARPPAAGGAPDSRPPPAAPLQHPDRPELRRRGVRGGAGGRGAVAGKGLEGAAGEIHSVLWGRPAAPPPQPGAERDPGQHLRAAQPAP
ncbi:cytochrome b5 domain-containing protein 1 isoform X3 [Gallus gallus]|uniref:cytochrome b5 domain-containing protein 1 isoform X3 n=1 Tax=Gallus gallus TaxID=9031 RepID=UPI001AE47200|nr:cytochrome b5 domain-containing protein 1 isoform X3 [Gallus gallus]